MKLEQITRALEPLAVIGSSDTEITGIAYDSRRVLPGNLFVAVPGHRADGHFFVETAINRGAAAVVLERDREFNPRTTWIKVSDARSAMALASAEFFSHPSQQLTVIGVTGTNGKTTTAIMIKSIMEEDGRRTGLLSTIQYEIGRQFIPASRTTPESVEIQSMMRQMVRAGCRGVSMEVSSHALELHRVDQVEFDAAVFTNLSPEHLDYHGTMEGYFAAKSRLFATLGTMKKTGRAVVNADDSYGRELIRLLGGDHAVVSYGVTSDARIRARDVRVSINGTYFTVQTPQGAMPISLPLIGGHNVSNALAAVGVALLQGIDLPTIQRGLAHMRCVPGRLEAVEVRQPFQVFVDYAHTEHALRNVLITMREFTRKRLIVVFGCGGDRDKSKRLPMGRAACELADFVVLTSDNPRTEDPREILQQIEQGISPGARGGYQIIEDRREAIEGALDIACGGDTVLIAGKGHETYQEFADTVVPFNDREVVKEYFAPSGRG